MTTLTYGIMPDYSTFVTHFKRAMRGEELYRVINCRLVGTTTYSCKDLYEQCCMFAGSDSEEENDWVSCILQTLNVEWVLS